MKAVIQCCKTKATTASFRVGTQRVKFVAHPTLRSEETNDFPAHPDDRMPLQAMTWREHLVKYNETGENPLQLKPAGKLYAPVGYTGYADLLRRFGSTNTYVLSAGWGLVQGQRI